MSTQCSQNSDQTVKLGSFSRVRTTYHVGKGQEGEQKGTKTKKREAQIIDCDVIFWDTINTSLQRKQLAVYNPKVLPDKTFKCTIV